MKPFLSCLCPTYRRPRLLENAIACFCQQDYPVNCRELVILDDAGQILPRQNDGLVWDDQKGEWRLLWKLFSQSERFPNLPAKYNALAALADPKTDAFVIWEDDDIYLPHHLAAHAAALERPTGDPMRPTAFWSKPSRVLSLYTGRPEQEPAAGRFFASIAVSRELWRHVGGLPLTDRADFDQQFLALLAQHGGPPADPLEDSPDRLPGYCFRWGSTGDYHGQGQMRSPADTEWYARCAQGRRVKTITSLHPRFDTVWAPIAGEATAVH